jgi:hypothetical protein
LHSTATEVGLASTRRFVPPRFATASKYSERGAITFAAMSGAPTLGSSKGKANGVGKVLRTQDIDGHDLPPSPAPSTPRNGRKYALMTELVYTESSDQYNASSVPIYQVHGHSLPDSIGAVLQEQRPLTVGSLQHSSKTRPQVAARNTITRALATLHGRTSSDTLRKS